AMLTYDYIITFDQEVALFWKRKITGATALFLATRYLALLSYSFFGAATFITNMSDAERQLWGLISLPYALRTAFSVLRVLALSGMNWGLAIAVSAVAYVPFALNVWVSSLGLVGETVPILGCSGGSKQTAHQALIGVTVSRSCAMAADLMVIAVTWRHTAKGTTLRGLLRGPARSSLANVLLVNGKRSIYFLLIVILNALQLAFTLLEKVVDVLDESSAIIIFSDPLTAILICRLLIRLQSANQKALVGLGTGTETQADEAGEQAETLRFATMVIGSLAESVLDGPDPEPGSLLDADDDLNAREGSVKEEAISEVIRPDEDA
ncbi:hypothetical protein BV20DRAFT_956028, partial [Pilatotrama ljubarskyi]